MNRKLVIYNLLDARIELKKINTSSSGIEVMATKTLNFTVKLTNIQLGAANILKQEMLSLGGDAAVASGVVNGQEKFSDVILLGTMNKIQKLIKKLSAQEIFGLKEVRLDLQKFINQSLHPEHKKKLSCNNKILDLSQIAIMGILNVTPDSFSDGNHFFNPSQAIIQAEKMIADGADIIDIGGESTRPGSVVVSLEEELSRVIPLIKAIRKKHDIIISVDTTKAEVAEQAIASGADIINDISALRFDENMISVLQQNPNIPIILMHMKGTPKDMQTNPEYSDTVDEILEFFRERINYCEAHGISFNRIIIDPGIGFGKQQKDNLILLKKLAEFHCLGLPILLGASRKSFINNIYPSTPDERIAGSLAASALAYQAKVQIVRVHDVAEHSNFLKILSTVEQNR